ncbi:hypothetical protein ABKA04_006785 [Annulohypoxylon sp. FPYF3050]
MNTTKPTPNTPYPSPQDPNHKDEWEDWEDSDEEGQVIIDDHDGLLIDLSDEAKHNSSRPGAAQAIPRNALRYSVQKPIRVKSKARQKAQNAKAGITLVTDMTKFRQSKQRAKFVNRTALQALEGEPSSASIGSFSWLKQRPGNASGLKASNKSAQDHSSDLSPVARPIVIGIAVPSDNLSDHQVSPQTAVIETPTDFPKFPPESNTTAANNPSNLTPHQLRSVWSPDTEASESPYQTSRAASSLYSQPSIYGGPIPNTDVPPVPALPTAFGSKERQTVVIADLEDDDDLGTPCTLFEEDGSPTMTRKSVKPKATMVSPESAGSRSHGWWDHVTTPFIQQTNNPFKQQAQETGPSPSSQQWNPFKQQTPQPGLNPSQPTAAVPHQWWAGANEKVIPSQPTLPIHQAQVATPSPLQSTAGVREWWNVTNEKDGPSSNAPNTQAQTSSTPVVLQQQYIVQPTGSSSRQTSPEREETRSEKARILLEENQRTNEEPPPYSPPKPQPATQVKYGVILPPPVVINSQRVPSPGPVTPGLAGTMTSQGAINMADIPLTPNNLRPMQAAVLPDRAPGSFRPGDHFYEARGSVNRTERQRRRHEKEDVIARKAGGFWRGRGCMPKNGCFGRRGGREGRKRRRICLCVIAALIVAIILAVVLGVVLTRRPRPQETQAPSIWLNLTDFPPMPTGVLTVSGPDNSLARTGCFVATSDNAWSCSLPKDQQDSVAPNAPSQPEFIFQIQYDNNTEAYWNITGDKDTDKPTLFDSGFKPDPQPPSIAEIRFLGNTTDHIQSDNKAGEPTPFFISTLADINKPVGANMLTRRQGPNNAIGTVDGSDGFNLTDILPPPQVNSDGTGAAAQLFPHSVQQPIRLFDRGLPTEHYGFYTYFDKTLYMVDTVKVNSADDDGGSTEASAKSLVTLSQIRFLVQIWTRMENSTQLLGSTGAAVPWTNGTSATTTPGTMPYPVTITEDMHGGDKNKKIDYRYGVEDSAINTTDAQLIVVNRGFAGTLINGANNSPNMSLGGIDGGTGGCKCEWINFKGLTKVGT